MMKVVFAMMVVIAVEWLNRRPSVTAVLLHAVLCASTHILKEFFAVMLLVAVVGVAVEWLNRIGTVFVAISAVKGMAMVFVVDALHRFGDLFAPLCSQFMIIKVSCCVFVVKPIFVGTDNKNQAY
jgi:hypothetical protein